MAWVCAVNLSLGASSSSSFVKLLNATPVHFKILFAKKNEKKCFILMKIGQMFLGSKVGSKV